MTGAAVVTSFANVFDTHRPVAGRSSGFVLAFGRLPLPPPPIIYRPPSDKAIASTDTTFSCRILLLMLRTSTTDDLTQICIIVTDRWMTRGGL